MSFKTARLVPLGKLREIGIPTHMVQPIEEDVLDNGQATWHNLRFTLMSDYRIAVERDYTPELSMENEETSLELSEIFAEHFEQDEKA